MARRFECDRCKRLQGSGMLSTHEGTLTVKDCDADCDHYELELCGSCLAELKRWVQSPIKNPSALGV